MIGEEKKWWVYHLYIYFFYKKNIIYMTHFELTIIEKKMGPKKIENYEPIILYLSLLLEI